MASANNALIGAVRVEASLDAGKFVDGAQKIQKVSKQTEATVKSSFTGMGAAIKSGIAGFVGALSVGYFTSIIKSALDYAGSLGEVAQQLGVTTKDLQTFRYMAGQVGVSQEQLETGLSKLTITLGKVAAGAEAPAKALQAIGISAKDVAGLDTGEAFRKISDGLEKVTDRSQRAAVEVALFGKSGANLDNMLAGGSDRINELSAAAERLGIVLSDEQIQRADDTADKLEALKTVLASQIAGVVADNADAIYKFADSLAHLISQIPSAINHLKALYAQFLNFSANVTEKFDQAVQNPLNRFNPLAAPFRGGQMHQNRLRNVQNDRAQAAAIAKQVGADRFSALFRKSPNRPRSTGIDIEPFLAPKSSSGRHKTGRTKSPPRDRSDDVAFEFAQEQRRAEMDILRAKQQLAGSSEQRAQLSLQIIALEKETADAEVQDRVRRAERDFAEGKITQAALDQVKVQAGILLEKNAEEARLKQRAFVEQQLARNEQATFEASQQRRQFEIDALQFADEQATTQADHRRIQIQILDAQIEQRRLELEHEKQLAVRNGATAEEIQIIQDKLDHLGAERAMGEARIGNNTRNPLEEWAATVPQTAQEITEAFQKIQADGLDRLSDSLADVILGTKSLKEAAHEMAASFIADSIRMITRMLLLKAITAAFGGFGGSAGGGGVGDVTSSGIYPTDLGFAKGGSFTIGGRGGTDANLMSINGLPIARVSKGERVSVSNDNGGMGTPVSVTFHNDFRGADQSAVAAIQARLDRMQAELPSTIVNTVQDAKQRHYFR